MVKTNSMGSEVVEGFACKPKVLDPDKPIMFSAVHLFICEGERCLTHEPGGLAVKVRSIVRELGWHRGACRVKVTRTHCNGACRFGQFAYAYKNVQAKCYDEENAFTAWKEVHTWSDALWKELITYLVTNQKAASLDKYLVEQQIFDDRK